MSVSFISKSKADISKRKNQLFKSSFGDLQENDIYFDPMGWRAGRPVNGKQTIYEIWKKTGALDAFDKYQKQGFTLGQTVEMIQKNYDTGDWSLPVFFVPEIHVVNPELTPASDLITRQAIQNDSVTVTAETAQASVGWGLETTDNSEGSYSYSDGTYTNYDYDVYGYGLASRLEDKLVLAANSLRSTQSVAQQCHMNSIRQAEEAQIFYGQTSSGNMEGDDSGFEGFVDWGSEYTDVTDGIDLTSDVNWKKQLRGIINELEYNGANPGTTVCFTDFETHAEIANDLDDYVRYETMGDKLGFGFRTMTFDGVPVMKTHGIKKHSTATNDGDPVLFAVDMSAHFMAMLQDVTLKPLAKVGPAEQFATDAYGCLVSEAKDKILYLASDGTLS